MEEIPNTTGGVSHRPARPQIGLTFSMRLLEATLSVCGVPAGPTAGNVRHLVAQGLLQVPHPPMLPHPTPLPMPHYSALRGCGQKALPFTA